MTASSNWKRWLMRTRFSSAKPVSSICRAAMGRMSVVTAAARRERAARVSRTG